MTRHSVNEMKAIMGDPRMCDSEFLEKLAANTGVTPIIVEDIEEAAEEGDQVVIVGSHMIGLPGSRCEVCKKCGGPCLVTHPPSEKAQYLCLKCAVEAGLLPRPPIM